MRTAINSQRRDMDQPLGHITITKLTREHIPLVEGEGTFGEALDRALEEAAMQGSEVQSFNVEIESEAWRQFACRVHGVESI